MGRCWFILVVVAAGFATGRPVRAQNVTGYQSMENPYLLLLREPAVVEDLKLTPQQRVSLEQLNSAKDSSLLALRNWPADKASEKLTELYRQTRSEVEKLLDAQQRRRLGQIGLQVRGIALVLIPQVAARLELSSEQQEEIRKALGAGDRQLEALAERLRDGESPQELQPRVVQVREEQQRGVLALLSPQQQQQLRDLVGPIFDSSRLGHARFRAPELQDSAGWIGSEALRLAELRGRVVVIHFWAFGCVNCHRNYPWYRQWQQAFADQPVTIIGIHTPETEQERNLESVKRQVQGAGFTFPVLADQDLANWNTWGNSIWPSVYLIDKRGFLRYWWYGELNWQGANGERIMREHIELLLDEPPA